MAANHLVQARIDGEVKAEAAAVLAAMGLTVSDAVRLLLTKIAHEKALPFEPLIPNETTIAAMRRDGKMKELRMTKHRGECRFCADGKIRWVNDDGECLEHDGESVPGSDEEAADLESYLENVSNIY